MVTRLLLIILLVIHGIIHLLGFVKAWRLAPVPQLSGRTLIAFGEGAAKFVGILWFIACSGFVASAAAFWLNQGWWWEVGIATLGLSEVLIILHWKDAWAGTIMNGILLPILITACSEWSFARDFREESRAMFDEQRSGPSEMVRNESIRGLPRLVQKWLVRSKVVGRERVHTVRLKQRGELRLTPDGAWMPFEAVQYFTIDDPGFLWKARVQSGPMLHFAARDRFKHGQGNMLIKLLSLFSIADAWGKEVDQGTMLRFLSETPWFPASAICPYLSWEAIDSTTVRVSMNYEGTSVAGAMRFNGLGDLTGFEAQRYGDFDGELRMETWSVVMKDWKEFAGIRIPYALEVTWKLKSGDFTWLRLEVTELEMNRPLLFDDQAVQSQ